ncbi:MAG TPA: histidine phosphatase family protein [Candidatus Dormibacteraeota bacterium]|nr:histidine phosphatase family protein [Candidatus Dormibacteraeota bacterium]
MPDDSRTAGFLKMIEELNARHLIGVDGVREIWLIRHADAYAGMQVLARGRIDTELSELGRQQAERLAARLASVPLHAVWSSDLLRARQTAEAIVSGRDLAVRVDHRLTEVRTHWDDGREEPEHLPPGSYPFPEPEAEVVERMRSVMADVVGTLPDVGQVSRAAVITHNAAIAIYLSSVLGLSWGQLRVMPQFTSVSVVAVKGDQVVVQSIGDVTHLTGQAGPV